MTILNTNPAAAPSFSTRASMELLPSFRSLETSFSTGVCHSELPPTSTPLIFNFTTLSQANFTLALPPVQAKSLVKVYLVLVFAPQIQKGLVPTANSLEFLGLAIAGGGASLFSVEAIISGVWVKTSFSQANNVA